MAELVIALAIPVFLLCIAAEAWISARRGQPVYRFNDAVTDIACGVSQRILGLLWAGSLLGAYTFVYRHAAIWDWREDTWVAWALGLLIVDLEYYVWHRTTHRSAVFWVGHVVHHQSEDYNLAVALRQAWFASPSALVFDLAIAVLGVPPVIFATANLVILLYQFWLHTEFIDRLGPLEWVLNTPSHHRVHHGVEPEYIDKNFGGIFIVWDRLFGTFAGERARPTYGTVKPICSWNPITANMLPVASLLANVRRARGLDRLRVLLFPPDWTPRGRMATPRPTPHRKTWDAQSTPGVHRYIAVHLIALLAGVATLLAHEHQLPVWAKVLAGAFVILTTAVWGGLFERKRWALALEWFRLAIVVGFALATTSILVASLVTALSLLSSAWLYLAHPTTR